MNDARALRRWLLGILALGIAGTGVELFLLDHMEEPVQWIPLVVLASSLSAVVWVALAPAPASLRTLQGAMVVSVLSGLVGLVQHFRGNMEFELEMYPTMEGTELFWKSITGATPALSPGAMILLGLLGLAFCHRHPAHRRED